MKRQEGWADREVLRSEGLGSSDIFLGVMVVSHRRRTWAWVTKVFAWVCILRCSQPRLTWKVE